MQALDKKQLKFKFTPEVDLFIVRQYAEFVNPMNICKNVVEMFWEYCEKDVEAFGENEFLTYLLRGRVNALSPGRKSFPQKYQGPYNEFREAYLQNLDNSYLSHRRNRMRELDKLYEHLLLRLEAEEDPSQFRQGISTAKDLIKEARAEMDTAKITVEASIEEGQARILAKRDIQGLSNEQIRALLKNAESGNVIDIPSESESENVTGDAGGGVSETGESGGRTPSESD